MKKKCSVSVTAYTVLGFNVETVEHKNVSFTSWDIGGRDKIVSNNNVFCTQISSLPVSASFVQTLLSEH